LDGVFERKGYYKEISKGAHLILTGGDPMIQQELLTGWFNYLDSIGRNSKRFFIEVETQGYIQPNAQFARKVHLWNVSPKLENSGVSDSKRFQRSVLEWHASANSCFKFPVRHQADLKEVEKIVRSCRIKRSRVYLMPVCDTQSEFLYLAPEVVRIAKLSGFCFSPRLQLVLWDKATGV
jgi:organic radical activating enzyme